MSKRDILKQLTVSVDRFTGHVERKNSMSESAAEQEQMIFDPLARPEQAGVLSRIGDFAKEHMPNRIVTALAIGTAALTGASVAEQVSPDRASGSKPKHTSYEKIAHGLLKGGIYTPTELGYIQDHAVYEEATPTSFSYRTDCGKAMTEYDSRSVSVAYTAEASTTTRVSCSGATTVYVHEQGEDGYISPDVVGAVLNKKGASAKRIAKMQKTPSGNVAAFRLKPQKDTADISFEYMGPGSLGNIHVHKNKARSNINE